MRTTVIRSGRTQSVRLPHAFALPEGVDEVEITRIGEALLITPVSQAWDLWFTNLPEVTADFMLTRPQPAPHPPAS